MATASLAVRLKAWGRGAVEGANVRVVQAGDGLRLALEPLLQIRVCGDMFGQHLDGDGAVQAGVAGFVDFAHPARAEGGEDLVGAERGAGLDGHGLGDWGRGAGVRRTSFGPGWGLEHPVSRRTL